MRSSCAVVVLGVVLVGCGGDGRDSPSPASPPLVPQRAVPALPESAAVTFRGPALLVDSDFTESDRNRDPFRSFSSLYAPKPDGPVPGQLDALVPQYGVDELKLVATVLSGDYPRAMVLDPTGKGWVLKRGDYVGRADTLHTGGVNGSDYYVNWRVDRVRDGELVLNRENRAVPGQIATRTIALHAQGGQDSDEGLKRL
ncbi:MAG: pilus assembly protein PilP [Polyangiaceae bacterium]